MVCFDFAYQWRHTVTDGMATDDVDISALEVIFYNEMRYINLRLTYLLTYLHYVVSHRPSYCKLSAANCQNRRNN